MKKLKSFIAASAVALSFLSGVLNPCLTISGAESAEDIFYFEQIDEDSDGEYDYISINDCKDSWLTEAEIPAEINGLPIKDIQTDMFYYCPMLKSINVDENNEYFSSIDGVLFNKDKTNLLCRPRGKADEQYSVPEGVMEISSNAFYNCSSLKSVTMPDSVIQIGESAFSDCYNLTNIKLSNNITAIKSKTFYCCGLTSLVVPDSVTAIGEYAFFSCPLETAKMSAGITEIDESAFDWCPEKIIMLGGDNPIVKQFAEKNGYILDPPIISNLGEHEFQLNSGENLILCFKPEEAGKYYFKPVCAKNYSIEYVKKNSTYYYDELTTDFDAGELCIINIEPYNNDYTENENENWSDGDSAEFYFNIYKEVEIEKEFSELEDFTIEANTHTTVKFTLDKDERIQINSNGIDYYLNNEDSYYDDIYGSYDLKQGTYTLNFDAVKADTPVSIKKYARNILDYKIDANKSGKMNTVSKNTVSLKNAVYDTYDNNLSYYIWTGIDVLQEVCDTAGNIYAVYGYNDSISVVPKNSGKKTITINKKGFTFGAAVIGDDNNLYVMWGKSIYDDVIDKSMKVANVIVTKYNLNGTELSSLPLPVEDTYAQFPFDAGNANIDYNNGVIGLLFDTEWLEKMSGDGLHHQGSVYVEIDAAKMKMLSIDTNTLSHSFGVSMIPTDYGFAAVQRGDAYSRGIVLTTFNTKEDAESYGGLVFHSSGQYGTNEQQLDGNATYVHMGGIAQSASTYAIVGKSERVYTTDIYYSSNLQTHNYDVFVKICDKSLRDEFATDCAGISRVDRKTGETADKNIVWLTKCSALEQAGNVKVVTLSDGSYCILWERFINGVFDSVRYVILDERGYTLREETPLYNARLSNTSIQPIVQNDTLTWAVADAYNKKLTWYSVDINKLSDGIKGDANCDGKVSIQDARFIAKMIACKKNNDIPVWADFNSDGKRSIKDARDIAKYIASRRK